MRFIPDLLDESQRFRTGREYKGAFPACQEKTLLAGSAIGPFGHRDNIDGLHLQFRHDVNSLGQLALASVDHQEIGQSGFTAFDARVPPHHRLAHSAVVVAGFYIRDIESTIVRFDRTFWPENNAGRDRGLPCRVTDVKTFDPFRQLRELECFL